MASMRVSLGFVGGLVALATPSGAVDLLRADPMLRDAVSADLDRLHARPRARDILVARRAGLLALARALRRRRFLSGDDVDLVLRRAPAAPRQGRRGHDR